MMRSLQSRLVIGTAVGTTVVLLVSGALLYVLVRSWLLGEFNRALADKARTLGTLVEQHVDGLRVEFDNDDMPEFRGRAKPEYFEFWLPGNLPTRRSESLGAKDLSRLTVTSSDPIYRRITLPDGRAGRSVEITFQPRREFRSNIPNPPPPEEVTLVVARETAGIDKVLGYLRGLLLAIGATAVLAAIALLTAIVRHGLKPMDRLAKQISAVGVAGLSARVHMPTAPTEMRPAIDRLNDLLKRLEDAFNRERSFTADVAHELRTPLAGLRSTLEVSMSKARTPREYQSAMQDSVVIIEQMQTMVDNLLSLARIEAGQDTPRNGPVRLGKLLQECWNPLEERARAKNLDVKWQMAQNDGLVSDREKLRLVLQNVLDNAVSYANVGGWIAIESTQHDHSLLLSIANSGSTLSLDETKRAFDRFWRRDTARSSTGLHCGLGLSLVKKLSTLLGGSATADFAEGGMFRLTLSFPAAHGATEPIDEPVSTN
jgi:two-component system, OmpR family, heavy metal sensor histidine kinase CusS